MSRPVNLPLVVPGASKSVDFASLVAGHLRDAVRRRAKAVYPEPLGVPRLDEGAVADKPGAHQGSGLGRFISNGRGEAILLAGDGVCGVAAICGVAGEESAITEILLISAAVAALPARRGQPADADAIARFKAVSRLAGLLHRPDVLVTGHKR